MILMAGFTGKMCPALKASNSSWVLAQESTRWIMIPQWDKLVMTLKEIKIESDIIFVVIYHKILFSENTVGYFYS